MTVEVKDRGIEFLIVIESRLCMFQLSLGNPEVFFGQIPFPSDQIHVCHQNVMVA